ncbi:hypothetical protein BBK36DRAFT_1130314 [Trichoderma citrinoviride]|uniref:Uncharacterized protein n=1 Tax=Trichoderma citrinoviride TaxID=58853 RepID=A0A2T4AYB1_9HYPO|nr:hypothetical protein BBK36DRAFT_1130314 [Trichoderma citrinoviride]PTB62053.1 hypothetical protein BBK36DRAFT_1130314 [Trichoderma citrinoviride]
MEAGNGLPKPVTANTSKHSLRSDCLEWLRHLRQLEKDAQVPLDEGQVPHSRGSKTRRAFPYADLSESDVFEVLHIHERYRLPSLVEDTEVADLPNFEDVTPYDVTKEQQKMLWEKEASRLVAVVQSDTPLEFEGSSDFKADSKKSYELLTDLAAQVWLGECIVTYDAQSLFSEHCKQLCYNSLLRRSRSTIDYICNKDDEDDDEEDIRDKMAQRATKIDVVNFINYVTAVFVRNFCMATEGKSFHARIIANLARISTKLKVVATRPLEFCQTSIANGVPDRGAVDLPTHYGMRGRQTGIMNEFSQGLGPMPESESPMLAKLRALDPERDGNPDRTSKKDSLRKMYYFNCSKHQAMIHEMLGFVLLSLRGGNQLTSASISSYEMTAIVFKTGFEKFPALVFQDRDNDFLGTSDASNINCARSAFHNLDQAIKKIHPLRPQINRPVRTNRESLRTPSKLRLNSMTQVISVIVPFLFTNPIAVSICEKFISLSIFTELSEERRLNPVKHSDFDRYFAFFSLSTKEYNNSQSVSQPHGAKSLSHSLIRQKTLLSRRHDEKEHVNLDQLVDDSRDSKLIEQFQIKVDADQKKMKSWVYEEKGVMVQCKVYVFAIMFLCVILVMGGIAFGASVGQRISGVDPFNVTSYCWVLAAFILLIAKSVRVHNWSWNDFLHGRVLCKSVSELSSVTGIDDQTILVKLLQDEFFSFLETRGPYNAVFRRRSQDDGFSIDRPLTMWTMLFSGLIMVEVEVARGRGLVCLDLRRGTLLDTIKRLGEHHDEESIYIHSSQLLHEEGQRSGGDKNTIRLKKDKTFWIQAVGFYNNKDAKFI